MRGAKGIKGGQKIAPINTKANFNGGREKQEAYKTKKRASIDKIKSKITESNKSKRHIREEKSSYG